MYIEIYLITCIVSFPLSFILSYFISLTLPLSDGTPDFFHIYIFSYDINALSYQVFLGAHMFLYSVMNVKFQMFVNFKKM